MVDDAAKLAICYLRKMRQWNEGKIDLAVLAKLLLIV